MDGMSYITTSNLTQIVIYPIKVNIIPVPLDGEKSFLQPGSQELSSAWWVDGHGSFLA